MKRNRKIFNPLKTKFSTFPRNTCQFKEEGRKNQRARLIDPRNIKYLHNMELLSRMCELFVGNFTQQGVIFFNFLTSY